MRRVQKNTRSVWDGASECSQAQCAGSPRCRAALRSRSPLSPRPPPTVLSNLHVSRTDDYRLMARTMRFRPILPKHMLAGQQAA